MPASTRLDRRPVLTLRLLGNATGGEPCEYAAAREAMVQEIERQVIQTRVLAETGVEVDSVEIAPEPEAAPFDGIIATAAANRVRFVPVTGPSARN